MKNDMDHPAYPIQRYIQGYEYSLKTGAQMYPGASYTPMYGAGRADGMKYLAIQKLLTGDKDEISGNSS